MAWPFFVAALLYGSAPAAADILAPVPRPVAAGDASAVRATLPEPGTPVPSASGVNYSGTIVVDFTIAVRSGNVATCKVSMPYGWYGLLSPARDYVSAQYTIAAGANLPGLVTTLPQAGAYLTGAIPIATLPANGKITTFAVDAIL